MRSLPGSNGAEFEEATYEGNFKAGKREGFGVLTWADGSQFRGIWKNDQRIEGEMLMVSGNIYRGKFSDDKFSGYGMYMLNNQNIIFEGEFENCKYSTVGKLLYANGDVYYGQHRVFIREGLGKLITIEGTIYEGSWQSDRKSGKGRLVDSMTGDIYVGEFNDGKKAGRGRIYNRKLEQIYEGEWSNDNK